MTSDLEYKAKALVAFEVEESPDKIVVNIRGVFRGRPGLAGRARRRPERSGGGPMTRRCVANAWQESQRRSSATNARQRVCAGQPHNANDDREQPLSVPRFPWYY
jgi:hypothetical protein